MSNAVRDLAVQRKPHHSMDAVQVGLIKNFIATKVHDYFCKVALPPGEGEFVASWCGFPSRSKLS